MRFRAVVERNTTIVEKAVVYFEAEDIDQAYDKIEHLEFDWHEPDKDYRQSEPFTLNECEEV